jgi:3-methylcrotonyl-CoA carboxylase alpha subunit
MVAKLIVHGSTREEALARMDAALMQTHIVGLATNVQFLRHVVGSTSFATAQLDTALIPREASVLFNQDKVGLPLAAAALVAHTLDQESQKVLSSQKTDAQGWIDPWARRDGWRSHGASLRSFSAVYQEQPELLQLTRAHAKGSTGLLLQAQGKTETLRFERLNKNGLSGALDITFGTQRMQAQVYDHGEVLHVFTPLGATTITRVDALAHAGDTHNEGGRLTAPMPGKVVSFAVKAGDVVKKGQPLAIMDAMKMEHTIAAPADGVVAELLFAPGDQVTEGAELLRLELPEKASA